MASCWPRSRSNWMAAKSCSPPMASCSTSYRRQRRNEEFVMVSRGDRVMDYLDKLPGFWPAVEIIGVGGVIATTVYYTYYMGWLGCDLERCSGDGRPFDREHCCPT